MGSRDAACNETSDVRTCAHCGGLADAAANFCAHCGHRLTQRRSKRSTGMAVESHSALLSSSQFERRQLTVMFCDLVDSTSLASRADPEDLNAAFSDFFAVLTEAVERLGGTVARYVGDGALVHFGYPEAHEDDAERAVQAALAILSSNRDRRQADHALAVRIGIATGVLVVGKLHAAMGPSMVDIAGEAAHVASRIQAHARPNTILVAASTRAMIGELFEWRRRGKRRFKGIGQPIEVWEVLGRRHAAIRFDALRGSRVSPMLGRDREREALLAVWHRAFAGEGRAVLMHGDAGIGKSRLTAAIADDVARSTGTVLRFGCSPTRQGSAFDPFIVFLEQAARFSRVDTDETRLAKLSKALADASADEVSLIADLIGIKHVAPASLASLAPRARRHRTMEAILSQVERVARATPALIVFEDAHWSDDSSRQLLEHLVTRIASLPALLLVLARPEFQPPWVSHAHVARLDLEPLSAETSTALVHFVAAEHSLPPRLVLSIVERADGLPLFIEEVTKAIVESDVAAIAPGSSERANRLLPFSLQASLLARLDRLGKAREIAQVASAIGREFSADLLRLVCDGDRDIDRLLRDLMHSGILLQSASNAGGYVFKHALLRDAAHALMNRERRHAVHLRIAEAIEKVDPDVAENHAEILAWHYTEARVLDKAATHWLRAGQQSLRRSATIEALGHLRQGEALVACLDDTPWRRQCELDLAVAVGMAQIATQGYAVPSTGDTFRKAHALCSRLANPPQALAVLHGLWTHSLMRADFPAALKLVDEIHVSSQDRDDPVWTLMRHRFRGCTRYFLGHFAESIADIDAGLAVYDPERRAMYATATVDDPKVVMLLYRAWALMCIGRFAEANRCGDLALEAARRFGHVYSMTHALSGRAFIAQTIGTPSEALGRIDELCTVLADNGIAYYEAIATIMRGWCMVAMGDAAAGLRLLDDGLGAYRAAGTVLYVSGFLRMAAECRCRVGHAAEARALIDEAIAVMDSSWQCWDAAEIHRVRGCIASTLHDDLAAEAALRRALDIARSQGAKLWEMRAGRDLSALLRHRGEIDESRQVLAALATHPHAADGVESARGLLGMAD